MPKHTQNPDAPKRRRSPRGIARWLLRFLAWSSALVVGTLLLVAIVAFVLYLNRVGIVNEALARLADPYRVSVERIELHRLGEIRMKQLSLAPKDAASERSLAVIEEAHITYDFAELRSTQQLKAVALKNVEVLLDDATLGGLADAAESSPEGTPGFDLSVLAYFTDSFSIEDGHIVFDRKGTPRIEADWQFSSGPLAFAEDGLTRERLAVELSDIVIGREGDKGRIARLAADARVNRDFSQVEAGAVVLARPQLDIAPDWFSAPDDGTEQGSVGDATGSDPPAAPFELTVGSFRVDEASIAIAGFERMPALFFDTTFELDDVSFASGRWNSSGPVVLRLDEVAAGEGESRLASAAYLEVSIDSLGELVHERSIAELDIAAFDAVVSDDSLAFLRSGDEDPDGADDEAAASAKPWSIGRTAIREGRFLMHNAIFGDSPAPRIETGVAATLEDLRFGGEGFSSDGDQTILLEQTRLWPPGVGGGRDPLLQIQRAELSFGWPDFDRHSVIDRLAVRGPAITFTDEALGDWAKAPQEDERERAERPVYKVEDLSVTDGTLVADSSFAGGRVPKIFADFSVETLESDEPFSYELSLSDVRLRNHPEEVDLIEPAEAPEHSPEEKPGPVDVPLVEEDVLSIGQVDVEFTASQIQRERRLGKVKLSGATLKVGEGLKAIVEPEPEATQDATQDPEPAPDAAAPEPRPEASENAAEPVAGSALSDWLVEEVEITGGRVEFQAVIPQVEGLEFTVETTLTDIPLSLEGLLAQDKLQKVELAGLEIKDPYDSFITVAELPTIFVEFSLAGLASQEIENIDLVAPSLYVGQGLFWWIEYQRNFREQNEGASVGIEDGGPVTTSPDWVIKTVNATAGKIVIAPTGIPIGVVPFPFNASTTMENGSVELQLNIPEEQSVYHFPSYEVSLHGLAGDVEFNVPLPQVNNNLVQTFSLAKAVWKDYEAEDLYITVTFDAEGVYGLFGGKAYDGYAEGGFDFYLNQEGRWDAWVSGIDFDAGPLTRVIAPGRFLMEGRLSLNLVSAGHDNTLGETTGEFWTTTPGWFDFTTLDEIFDKLPEEWNSLQRSAAELSLVALKRFDYEQGAGSLYLLGRDGEFDMRFTGPYGSRELTLHAHDERNTTAEAGARKKNTPSAAARPAR